MKQDLEPKTNKPVCDHENRLAKAWFQTQPSLFWCEDCGAISYDSVGWELPGQQTGN